MRSSALLAAIGHISLLAACPTGTTSVDGGDGGPASGADAGASVGGDAGNPLHPDGGDSPACSVPSPQACFGDRVVESVDDLTALDSCAVLEGNLSIIGGEMTDLAPLACLRRVVGDLTVGVDDDSGLPTQPPFPDDIIVGPTMLTSVRGLEGLEEVTGTLRVVTIPVPPFPVDLALVDLSALDDLTVGHVELDFRAAGGPVPMPALEVASAASVRLGRSISGFEAAQWPPLLADLTLASGVTDVELAAFSALEEVSGALTLRSTNLTALSGLSNLNTVGTLEIDSNFDLASLDGLAPLTSLSGLNVTNNFNLTDFSGLGATSVTGDVSVHLNDEITEYTPGVGVTYGIPLDAGLLLNIVDGDLEVPFGSLVLLENLLSVSGDVSLGRGVGPGGGLSNVTDLEALGQLSFVGGDLNLGGLIAPDLSGLSGLTSVGGVLSLSQCFDSQDPSQALLSVAGLNPELHVTDGLVLFNNLIASLSGLPLSGELARLEIRYEQALSDLAGLEAVTSVGTLAIESSPQLSSLSALSSLTNADTLTLQDLPLVPACEATAFASALGHTAGTGFREGCTCADTGTVCDVQCVGDVSVDTQADLDALASVPCSGHLWIGGDELTSIDLPLLEDAGAIHVSEAHNLTMLNLPALERAVAVTVVGVSSLAEIHLPNLQEVTGPQGVQIECSSPAAITSPLSVLDLSSVQTMQRLYVTDCEDLPLCALEADVSGIPPAEDWFVGGLDESCSCDVAGDVILGTCAP